MENKYKAKKIDGETIAEHRLVFEKALGRKLTKREVVHHIDGNKSNNDIENLILFPTKKAHAKYHFDQGDLKLKSGSNKKKLIDGKLKCCKCGKLKKVKDFATNSEAHLGVKGVCKVCYRIQDRKWKSKSINTA